MNKDYVRLLREERDALRKRALEAESKLERYTEHPLSKAVRLLGRAMCADMYTDPDTRRKVIDGKVWISEEEVDNRIYLLEQKYAKWTKNEKH